MIIWGQTRKCVKCGEFYQLLRGKPGYISECGPCGEEHDVRLKEVSPEVLAVTDFGDFEFAERVEIER